MESVGGGVVVRPEGQVELLLADVVGLGVVPQPGQLQLEGRLIVAHVHDDERSVGGLPAADLPEPQGLVIEGQGRGQVPDVVVFVDHFEFHGYHPLRLL